EVGPGVPDANRDGLIDCPGGFGANGLCNDIETAADSGITDYNNDNMGPDAAVDTDGDLIRDCRDLDADGDGIADVREGRSGCADANNNGRCDGPDADGNGLADDATNQVPPDTDGDGAPDFLDLDADNDGGTDLLESGNGCRDT